MIITASFYYMKKQKNAFTEAKYSGQQVADFFL